MNLGTASVLWFVTLMLSMWLQWPWLALLCVIVLILFYATAGFTDLNLGVRYIAVLIVLAMFVGAIEN